MYYGTHNTCTGYPIKGWYKLLWPIAKLTAECQNTTIKEQYDYGTRYFQLQIAWNGETWYCSHGIVLYDITLEEALRQIRDCLQPTDKVYVDLGLDNNFFTGSNEELFEKAIEFVENYDPQIILNISFTEKNWSVTQYVQPPINSTEQYWTMTWAKQFKNLLYRLPLPKYWAKKNNAKYKKEFTNYDYLMLDYVTIG